MCIRDSVGSLLRHGIDIGRRWGVDAGRISRHPEIAWTTLNLSMRSRGNCLARHLSGSSFLQVRDVAPAKAAARDRGLAISSRLPRRMMMRRRCKKSSMPTFVTHDGISTVHSAHSEIRCRRMQAMNRSGRFSIERSYI